MGGDGQSTTILQSLRDAGLVVTVIDGKYGNTATAVLAINTVSRPYNRSLGINTKLKPSHHSSTQANDSLCMSAYQLAHCGLKPTSPSVHLPEFPLQRTAPNITQGNFEVRGWKNQESQYMPVTTTHSYRRNLHWTDRVGSAYRWSENTSAFAHSLRKYPNLSPTRSLSTELVQRLLTYTQNKSFSKSSYHTRNVFATTSPLPDTKPTECTKKSSKTLQTSTKNKRERTDKASNTTREIKYQRKLSRESKHIMKDKKLSNTNYDYLKRTKPRGWNTKGTEVRYLTDVTKCIKDAIRNICEEAAAPAMCPSVRSRYSHHRRRHHLHTNGQQATSVDNKNGEGASLDENTPYGLMRCDSPNNVYQRVRNRNNQNKIKRRGGHQSCSVFKTIEIQASPPPVVREACVMTKSESYSTLPHVCQKPVKACCYCKKPLPCHCRSETNHKIEKEVLDWIKEIPVYSDDAKDNKHMRCMLSKKLIQTLEKMIKNTDFGNLREEIDKCLNVLPMWYPENEKHKTIFKNQMAGNLINRLKQFMVKDFIKDQIVLWFNELAFKDEMKAEDKEQFLNNFVNSLKAVDRSPNDNDYKEALKNATINMLNELPGIDKDVVIGMVNKLADNLVLAEEKESAQNNELRENICDWIDNRSEFVENGFCVKDNIQLMDDLSKILTGQQQLDTDIENIKKLMKTDVIDWLQTAYKNKNVFLDINTKSKLAQKLIDKIYANQKKTVTDQYVRSIIDWIKSTPELSHFVNETTVVESLATKLRKLQKNGYNNDDAPLEVILDWLNQLCVKHGIMISPNGLRQHGEKIMDQLKLRIPRKDQNLAKDFKETISNELSRMLESDVLSLNSKVKNNLLNKITNILSNSIEKVLSNEITSTKKEFVKLLQHEANMTPEDAKALADTAINSTKTMSLAEVQKESPAKYVLSQNNIVLKRDISEVDELNVADVDNKEDREETISNILPNEMIRGTKAQITRNDILIFLNKDSVSDEQCNEVTPRLVKRQRVMSIEPTSPDLNGSNIAQQQRSVVSGPIHKDAFNQNVERTIIDFINDVLVNHSSKTTENMRTGAKLFIDNVSHLIQINNDKESVLTEVQSFLNSIPISSDITRKELADELTNRLLGTGFQTSTPRKDLSFPPRHLTFDSSLASVHFEDGFQQMTEESKYMVDLTKVVKNWLDRMPLSINESESKRFKDIVINDLVGDMIDRQKYLQMNPGVKTLDIDELENLKYQVFRWLNKVMDARDFDIVMPQIEELMDAVRGVAVPQLAKRSGVRRDDKKSQGQVPNYLDALQDEISMWVDDIPKHLLQSTDKKYHEQMIRELVKHLQHVNSGNVNSQIKQWLQKFFRFSDQDDINKAAEDLNQRLARKGFSKDISWMMKQDSSEFIEENLHGAILDWLKQSPYYKSANTQDRNFQERIVAGMAKSIKNVFEIALTTSEAVNTNDLFMDEIVKHMKGFPMDKNKKTDPGSLNNIAANLLQYLKGLQMFQNISDRRSFIPQNHLNNGVEQWIKSLPFVDKESLTEAKPLKTLTKHFKQKLNDLSVRRDDKDLREEIKKQLKMLPIDPVKLNDDKFINKKIEQLFKTIRLYQADEITGFEYEDFSLDIDSNFNLRHEAKSAADTLSETVNKFCDSLLIENGILSEDTEKVNAIKHSMASKLMRKIEELNVNPEIINDDFLQKHILENELDNFISVSQPSAETGGTVIDPKNNLVNKAKDNTKSELASQIYKQQLRDTISKTLSPTRDLSVDEKTSFEVLKENLADAFINLHFYSSNTEEREKYKIKINKEISKFCNDYLKKHPSKPIESEKLNKDLYTMLNNITFPTEDYILEVDETNIKDLITDCANELPLSQDTSAEKLQADRVMSLMSKQLHELEKEKNILDNYEGILKNEICKWTKKLPLQYWRENEIRDFANKLVDELKRTESSRRTNLTTMNTVDFDQTKHSLTPPPLSREQSRPSRVTDNVTPRLPPSLLSSEDHDHLQRIRERSMFGRHIRTSPSQKDAAISPAQIDAESQTEIRPSENYLGIQRSPSIQTGTQIDQPPHVCQSPACGLRLPRPWLQSEGSNCHISPERRTKFYWPMQDKLERLLPRYIIQPKLDPQDMKSSSCECQPKFIPYSFSPGQNYAVPRPCMPPPSRTPNVFRPFQYNAPEDVPTPKRPKRRDPSPRREERPKKTIRPRTIRLGACGPARCTSKTPANHEPTYGIRHLNDASSRGKSSRRKVLISDDEFDDQGPEEFKCRCKEKNPYGRDSGLSCKRECLKRCPKCCGVYCPHPTHLYFRN